MNNYKYSPLSIANTYILNEDMTAATLTEELLNFDYDLTHLIDLIIDDSRDDEVLPDDDKNTFEYYRELPPHQQSLIYSHIITHCMYILIINSAN